MSCNTPNLEEFLQAHVDDIQQLLLGATSSVRSASKKVGHMLSTVVMVTT